MKKLLFVTLIFCTLYSLAANCKLINLQCSDNAPTKVINGVTFNLSDACAKYGLTGNQCCWSSSSQYYCEDNEDTCSPYRQNSNCKFVSNKCQVTDPISGACTKAQTTFNCASVYQAVESQICTNAICVNNQNNNESDQAHNCFMPADIANKRESATSSNVNNLASILSFLEIGKQGGDELQNCGGGDPLNCTIFKGSYYTCDIYNPDSPWNSGSDCLIHQPYFSTNLAGENVSDKAMYGSVAGGQTSANGFNSNGNNYTVGDRYSYGLSNQDQQTITSLNNNIKFIQSNGGKVYNSDTGAVANPNARSQYMSLSNSQVNSVTINDYTSSHLGTWNNYLDENSAKLAWNRIKADPDPFNALIVRLMDLGITKPTPSNVTAWGNDKPIYVQGLCAYLSNYNDGGNQADTDSVAGRAVCLGNANCGAKCSVREPISGACLVASAVATREEWCCFNSKIAMDINLAAYDQGLTSFYRSNSKFINGGNVVNVGGKCGGLTIGQISQIDFTKGNYLKDFQNSINVPNLNNIVNLNSVNGGAQGAIQNRITNSMQSQINTSGK